MQAPAERGRHDPIGEAIEPPPIAGAVVPADESEIDAMGVTLIPSVQVKPPRIKEAPAHLECKLPQDMQAGGNRVRSGDVVHMHLRDNLGDTEKMHIHHDQLSLLDHMPCGSGGYAKTSDLRIPPRTPYDDMQAGRTMADLSTDIVPEAAETTHEIASDIGAVMPSKEHRSAGVTKHVERITGTPSMSLSEYAEAYPAFFARQGAPGRAACVP